MFHPAPSYLPRRSIGRGAVSRPVVERDAQQATLTEPPSSPVHVSGSDATLDVRTVVLEPEDLRRPLLRSDPDIEEAAPATVLGLHCCCAPPLAIAALVAASDLLGAFASGMTVKFFAIFFLDQVRLSPAAVAGLGAACPCAVALASKLAQVVARRAGRVQVSLVTRLLDIALLLALAFLPPDLAALLVLVHVCRTAVANSTRPLMRSILMEVVPKRYRGKANALESMSQFSWSGSAALGG